MKQSTNKVLIAAISAFMASQAEASAIHNSCLRFSDNTIGDDRLQLYFTNEDQLTSDSAGLTDDMRLFSVKACQNSDEDLLGLQFILSRNNFGDENVETFGLNPIGQMSSECPTYKLSGEVSKIKASYTDGHGVSDLKLYNNEGLMHEIGDIFGELGVDKQRWDFTEDNPVVGIYGNHSEDRIEKLGFITLNKQCQAAFDEVVEEEVVEVGVVEEGEGEEEVEEEGAEEEGADEQVVEEEGEGDTQTDPIVAPEGNEEPELQNTSEPQEGGITGTQILVIVGIIVFLVLVALSVVAVMCKDRLKRKGDTNESVKADTDLEKNATSLDKN